MTHTASKAPKATNAPSTAKVGPAKKQAKSTKAMTMTKEELQEACKGIIKPDCLKEMFESCDIEASNA